jgi:hypothetical protein
MLHKFLMSDAFIVFALVAVTTVFLTLILSFQ